MRPVGFVGALGRRATQRARVSNRRTFVCGATSRLFPHSPCASTPRGRPRGTASQLDPFSSLSTRFPDRLTRRAGGWCVCASIITGGGTGGHTSAGLAVAAALRARRRPGVLGRQSGGGIEARRAPEAGIAFHDDSVGQAAALLGLAEPAGPRVAGAGGRHPVTRRCCAGSNLISYSPPGASWRCRWPWPHGRPRVPLRRPRANQRAGPGESHRGALGAAHAHHVPDRRCAALPAGRVTLTGNPSSARGWPAVHARRRAGSSASTRGYPSSTSRAAPRARTRSTERWAGVLDELLAARSGHPPVG